MLLNEVLHSIDYIYQSPLPLSSLVAFLSWIEARVRVLLALGLEDVIEYFHVKLGKLSNRKKRGEIKKSPKFQLGKVPKGIRDWKILTHFHLTRTQIR